MFVLVFSKKNHNKNDIVVFARKTFKQIKVQNAKCSVVRGDCRRKCSIPIQTRFAVAEEYTYCNTPYTYLKTVLDRRAGV